MTPHSQAVVVIVVEWKISQSLLWLWYGCCCCCEDFRRKMAGGIILTADMLQEASNERCAWSKERDGRRPLPMLIPLLLIQFAIPKWDSSGWR